MLLSALGGAIGVLLGVAITIGYTKVQHIVLYIPALSPAAGIGAADPIRPISNGHYFRFSRLEALLRSWWVQERMSLCWNQIAAAVPKTAR
jgi:hypothetical protein